MLNDVQDLGQGRSVGIAAQGVSLLYPNPVRPR